MGAVALGASILERHLRIPCNTGPDIVCSMDEQKKRFDTKIPMKSGKCEAELKLQRRKNK
jgi:sialic acid synthase SpsE